MALIDKLTNIANAVREKTGVTSKLTLDAIPGLIRNIQSGTSEYPGVPTDIVTEAKRVASSINSKKTANSITFIVMSDSHELGDADTTNTTVIERNRRSNLNAGQAAKIVSDMIQPDFFAHLGDFAFGANTTTIKDGVESILRVREYIADVVRDNESFLTVGNHDPLTYSYGQNGDYLDHNVLSGIIGNYRYVDFADKKIRVICLNTSEIEGASITYSAGTERITGTQLQWFANALDLSGKSDAAKWGIIILSHHPLDWGEIKPAGNCLAAYLNGTTFSTTHTGTAVSYNFSGKNAATVIAQFHGHVHGFKVDYINDLTSGTAVPTSVRRLAVPNTYFDRNNEYGTNGKFDSNNIEFGQTVTFKKTDDGKGRNTAFCVVTIDLTEQVIYADCFGSLGVSSETDNTNAGYDRTVQYGSGTGEVTTYTVTNNLSNATTSNGVGSVTANSQYIATITANSGYELSSVTVTMGGVNVTSSYYSNGTISIPSVTGDIVITVNAVKDVNYNVRNLVLEAEEQNSTALYNGTGYKNGYYLSSNGGESVDSSCVATGYIQYKWTKGDAIYIRGATVSTNSHVRIYGYVGKVTTPTSAAMCTGSNIDTYFTLEYPEGTGVDYYKLTVKDTKVPTYIRISVIGTGENLIVTINEPIVEGSSGGGVSPEPETPVTHSVTNNLTNASNGNTATTVTKGSSYSATITANSGYELSSITVTMGGTNVTSSVVSGSKITISNVTGNIVITATATEIVMPDEPIVNLVPTAIADSSGAIYNAPYGYKNGYYLSSGTINSFSTDADCVATGSIYIDADVEAIYVKGATWDTTNSHVRFLAGAAVGGISYLTYANGTGANPIGTLLTLETLGDNYYKFTLTADGKANLRGKYYRFSLKGTGANLIITHDQPIT